MLLKLKICTTVLVAYEIIVVLLAHFRGSCNALFGNVFCNDHVFKYFILCFAIPAIVWLIGMWIAEIVHVNRRHHSFMYRAKSAVRDAADVVREKIHDHVSQADMEKLLAAALLIGIKKYVSKHPTRKHELKRAMDGNLADIEFDEDFEIDSYDDESDNDDDEQDDDDDYTSNARRVYSTNNRRTTQKKTSRKK